MLFSLKHDRDYEPNTSVMQGQPTITPVTTLADRLKTAREAAGLTQAQLAKAAGLKSQATIGNVESGARKTLREVVAVADALHIRPQWLSTGAEPMRAEHQLTLSTEEHQLIMALRSLPEGLQAEHRGKILELARYFEEQTRKLLAEKFGANGTAEDHRVARAYGPPPRAKAK